MQIFNNPEFGQIRSIEINGEPWLAGKDVALALGYSNTNDALGRHVDDEDKRVSRFPTPSGEQEMTIISESGLYSLVLSSKLKTAKKFKHWVTSEVLPTIRRTGGYVNNEAAFVNTYLPYADENTKAMFSQTLAALRAANEKIAQDAPKVLFHDAVALADDTILIRDLAKLLKQNGVPNMGGTRLYTWLRENGYLCKEGASYNLPTQRSMELGLFRIRESSRIQNGEVVVDKTPKVTGKGQAYFIKKFLTRKEAAT
ncbi:phage antirepressor KilAC domain-containing protein [uncultured Dysosmobacter sp.]|uniref:phage antirepressor KilAC domain-containing protein n=1 Tax=uncultured Dysosmobacter sp. TaxID=2591384 RepID=UPI00260DD32B|nr:phage antirepressor KilAC domain-containing protein [uncultured Dysosmobacter sp.]